METIRSTAVIQDERRLAEIVTSGEETQIELLVEVFSPEDLEALAVALHRHSSVANRDRGSQDKAIVLDFLAEQKRPVHLKEIQAHLKVTRPTADKVVSQLVRDRKVCKRVDNGKAGQPVLYWLAPNGTNIEGRQEAL